MNSAAPPDLFRNTLHTGKHQNYALGFYITLLIDYLLWHHYGLLVCAIHIMLGVRITQDEVDAAEQMLIDFCVLLVW